MNKLPNYALVIILVFVFVLGSFSGAVFNRIRMTRMDNIIRFVNSGGIITEREQQLRKELMLRQFSERLKLTDAQRVQARGILDEGAQEMKTLADTTRDDAREIFIAHSEKLHAILDAEQQARFQEMLRKRNFTTN